MEVEMDFASCKMAEKWFSIQDLIKCERGSWIFASCPQEPLFPWQTLCLLSFALEVPSGAPTALSKHRSVITGRWSWGCVGFQMLSLVWCDGVCRGEAPKCSPGGWLLGWLHHNHLGCLLVLDFLVRCIEMQSHQGLDRIWKSCLWRIPWWLWRKLAIIVNKLANRKQKINSIGLLRISFGEHCYGTKSFLYSRQTPYHWASADAPLGKF